MPECRRAQGCAQDGDSSLRPASEKIDAQDANAASWASAFGSGGPQPTVFGVLLDGSLARAGGSLPCFSYHAARTEPRNSWLGHISVVALCQSCRAGIGRSIERGALPDDRLSLLARCRRTVLGVSRDHQYLRLSCDLLYLAGSTERLALTGCRSGLNRVQHAMARDRVVERGAEMRSLAIVASETRVCLGDVGGRARALRRRPPILLWHRQDLERGLRALAAAYGHLEDLGLAACGGGFHIAPRGHCLPEQVCGAPKAAPVVGRKRGP